MWTSALACIPFPTMTRKLKFLTAHNYDYKMAKPRFSQFRSFHISMVLPLCRWFWINVVALLQLKVPLTCEKQVWLVNVFIRKATFSYCCTLQYSQDLAAFQRAALYLKDQGLRVFLLALRSSCPTSVTLSVKHLLCISRGRLCLD